MINVFHFQFLIVAEKLQKIAENSELYGKPDFQYFDLLLSLLKQLFVSLDIFTYFNTCIIQ